MEFSISSPFSPTGDQPQAIEALVKGFNNGEKHQVLLGVTGSGKTYTIANVIQKIKKPTLVLAHNKTLAAQLYLEFKDFFPQNAVEYFVSYYDYYQPEAFIPTTGTYIEKDLSINEEIEKLRLATISSLFSGRRDIIVIASVSCLYGIGDPKEFENSTVKIEVKQKITRTKFLQQLVNALYARSGKDFGKGNFRVVGDIVDIFPVYSDIPIRVKFYGDEIEQILFFDLERKTQETSLDKINIYPSNIFVTSPDRINQAIKQIQLDLGQRISFFQEHNQPLEARRIQERVELDLEMMKEIGYCSGIENYSRYLDGREPGSRPFCLLDCFPDDYLMVIDESHATIPQVHAMYGGDRSRKENLVDFGFRLPAAMDNRPLKFLEFESIQNQVIYVSATPADYELQKTEGLFISQIIRPTGLLEPIIEIKPSANQIDDLMNEIQKRIELDERILVTTLTKRMAEELTKYLTKYQVRTRYIHSDVDTLERVEIMRDLREGLFDVLVGVNLLREGLDLPEVSLVAILDADKEGFLRSHRALTQTAGRAARNINGRVIMYADKITQSMQKTIDETNIKREKQIEYNLKNNITPKPLNKKIHTITTPGKIVPQKYSFPQNETNTNNRAAEDAPFYGIEKDKMIEKLQKEMEGFAKNLDFINAAKVRDKIAALKN
jgi:excinuclease ABC subunit B